MKIIFVRHGKDDDRYRGGWSNLDLIPEGREQAQKLAKHLNENKADYNISCIISSDLPRTMTTANIVSDKLELPVLKEARIRETNNGDLAGMLNDEALIKYPGLFFSLLKMDEPYPNGESPNDFYIRIKIWFESFIAEHRNLNGNILVVTHSGVINVIYHIVKNIEWSNKGSSFKISNCSIHILNTETMTFEIENKVDYLLN
ncbi:MAG: histidine phosphatase family protein [Clostridia bacterium]|nr:histidine phosphatase family protein [Clostridia bacterium]